MFGVTVFTLIFLLVRCSLGGIILVAGISKLSDIASFVKAVEAYNILPTPLARAFGRILPYLEFIVGLFLFVGLGTNIAVIIAILLFTSFAIAIGINLLRNNNLDCNCFGKRHSEKISWATFARSVLLAILAFLLIFFPNSYLSLDEVITHSVERHSTTELLWLGLLVLVLVSLVRLISFAQQTLSDLTPYIPQSQRTDLRNDKDITRYD